MFRKKKDPTEEKYRIKKKHSLEAFGFYFSYSWREVTKHKCHYCVAFTVVMIVVISTFVGQTMADNLPLIFLKLAESEQGERDVVLSSNYPEFYLNYTRVDELLGQDYSDTITPRLSFNGRVNKCVNDDEVVSKTTMYSEEFAQCFRESGKKIDLMVIDSEMEKKAALGSRWDKPPLAKNECYISSKLARSLKVSIGEYIYLRVSMWTLPKNLISAALTYETWLSTYFRTNSSVFMIPVKVKDTFTSLGGKGDDKDTANTIFMEIGPFFDSLFPYIPPEYNDKLSIDDYVKVREYIQSTTASDFAMEIIINLPSPRSEAYLSSNYDTIQAKVTGYTSKAVERLGYFPIETDMPILQAMQPMNLFSTSFGIILSVIIFFLTMISIMLNYTLLMSTVESRSFEIAIQRMLGSTKAGVVKLIVVQSFTYIIPAYMFGIFFSFMILLAISETVFKEQLGSELNYFVGPTALILSFCLGVFIPLISSIVPIRTALSQHLNEALDLNHSKTKGVTISISSVEKSVSWTTFSFGVISILYGFLIYYLLPLALFSLNLLLFGWIFFLIILGLIIGLAILSLNMQHIVERVFASVCFFWQHVALNKVLTKNLVAHRVRNRRTAILFSVGFGFLCFFNVWLTMELTTIRASILASKGVYFDISGGDITPEVLGPILDKYDFLEDYSFESTRLDYAVPRTDDVFVSNLGRVFELPVEADAIPPNYFKVTLNEFMSVYKQYDWTSLVLSEQLYTPRGSQSAILGGSFEKELPASLDWDKTYLFTLFRGVDSHYSQMRTAAMLDSAPGQRYSHYPGRGMQTSGISYTTWLRLSGGAFDSVDRIDFYRVLLKLSYIDDNALDEMYAEIRNKMGDKTELWDFREIEDTLNTISNILSSFFTVIAVVVALLCLFGVVASMTSNIMDQSKEICVMRAIGITSKRMVRVYVEEAFVVILAASMLGIMIGFVTGWSVVAQRSVITDLPLEFYWPWQMTVGVLFVAIAGSFVSTYFPAKSIMKLQIAKIMRLIS